MNSRLTIIALPLLLATACSSEPSQAQRVAVDQTELQAAAGNSPAAQFYKENGWQSVWTDAAEKDLRDALGGRAKHGLDHLRFLQQGSFDPAHREVALTEGALGYAAALAGGIIDPGDLYDVYTIPVPRPDLVAGMVKALAGGSLREWLAGLAPQDEEYAALSKAYLRYRDRAQEGTQARIEGGAPIHEGERDPRVPRIAAALRREGYLQSEAGDDAGGGAPGTLFTPDMSRAVESMQSERGIAVDGIVGPDTLEALNTGAADRARAAAVALERRRWLERDPPATRIDVNTASTMLTYYRGGRVVDRRKVIAGRPGWETPQLQAPIFRLVANPTWTVPHSIERQELANVGPAGLRARNMVRRDGWIVQRPGPDNALGLVKFDMDDDYAIYLHDTPSKSLFARNVRQLSHGCVRVDDALGFAQMLAQQQGIGSEWQKARASGKESFLRLPDKLPVRLLYHPTYLDPAGEVRFAQDVYGWNGPLGQRLGFGKAGASRVVAEISYLGP